MQPDVNTPPVPPVDPNQKAPLVIEPSAVLTSPSPVVSSAPPTPTPAQGSDLTPQPAAEAPTVTPVPSPLPPVAPAAPTAPVMPVSGATPLPDITVIQTASVSNMPNPSTGTGPTTLDPHPAPSNIFTEICGQIIREQERIIGVIALEQATHVTGLKVDPINYRCEIIGDGSQVIDNLIEQYRDFFGHAAVEVCKEAASKYLSRIPEGMVPSSLR